MEGQRKKIVIRDVAKLSGVAVSTVSRVLTNKKNVSKGTEKRVLEAIEKLDYVPSVIARSLRKKAAQIIGVILPIMTNPFFVEIVHGVEEVAFNNKYLVVLCNSAEEAEREALYFEIFKSQLVSGVIYCGSTESLQEGRYIKHIKDMYKKGIPIVLVDREIEEESTSVVAIDNELASFNATKYCLNLGHKNIAFIAGSLKVKKFQERLKGYKKALIQSGARLNEELMKEGDMTIRGGRMATKELLKKRPFPSAIFASTDLMAIGVLKEIQENGLNVPGDISVIGWDDIPIASLVTPPLTTVVEPAHKMGKEAANLLLRQIEGEVSTGIKVILDTEIVIRNSTAPYKEP